MSWLKRFWRWLTKPSDAYPNPPHLSDDNQRGLGWGGDRGPSFRPFDVKPDNDRKRR